VGGDASTEALFLSNLRQASWRCSSRRRTADLRVKKHHDMTATRNTATAAAMPPATRPFEWGTPSLPLPGSPPASASSAGLVEGMSNDVILYPTSREGEAGATDRRVTTEPARRLKLEERAGAGVSVSVMASWRSIRAARTTADETRQQLVMRWEPLIAGDGSSEETALIATDHKWAIVV
jgi:hypothetical protein